jgi:hypothetical protein
MAKYTWSYSSATTFEKCPKQYYHLYVAKDIKQDPNQKHFLYGNAVHKAAEEYVRDGVPLPEKFKEFQSIIDKLLEIPGEKHCELRLGLTKTLEPCGFFDDNVWWRGAVDLMILDKDKKLATIIDYKTGKSSEYADTKQLGLLSLAIFKHFPEVEKIKAGLIFLVCKDIIKQEYNNTNISDIFAEWSRLIQRMDTAYDTEVFNPIPNFACKKFCPVQGCPHWGK